MPRAESIVRTDIHEYSCNEEKYKAVQTGLLNSFPPQGRSPSALSLVSFSIAQLACTVLAIRTCKKAFSYQLERGLGSNTHILCIYMQECAFAWNADMSAHAQKRYRHIIASA